MATFTKRDLGNLLSDVTGASGAFTSDKGDEFKPLKPRLDPTKKVTVYRPGQRPAWLQDDKGKAGKGRSRPSRFQADASARPGPSSAAAAGSAAAAARGDSSSDSDAEEGRPRRRVAAAVIEDSDSDEDNAGGGGGASKGGSAGARGRAASASSSDEDAPVPGEDALSDDAIAQRRARIRARLVAESDEESGDDSDEEEEEAGAGRGAAGAKPDGSGSDGSSSEYETDTDASSEEEEEAPRVLFKPVFRRKEDRVTVAEQRAKEKEEAEKEKARLAKLEERKVATMDLVASEIKRDDDALLAKEEEDDAAKPDDTDDPEQQDKEYELWAERELTRIKRDRDEREEKLKEQAETERRRKLTPAELDAENKILEAQGLKVFKKDKRKLKFLQKYYHKGAFFMDEDTLADANDVRNKRYDGATGEDQFDFQAMPEVRQVKKFGLMGRTKWTHLSKEDTTSFDSPWMAKDNIRRKMAQRMAGVHGDLNDAGRRRKRARR